MSYTLKDLVRRARVVNPDGVALIADGGRLTWEGFESRVRSIAAALVARGLKAGDRVAIVGNTGPHYFEMLFAALWAGGVVAPINTRFAQREIIHCLDDLDGVWLCADAQYLSVAEAVRPYAGQVHGLVFMGPGEAPAGYLPLSTLPPLPADASDGPEPAADDLAIICFTGGTTGLPKGVMLTHAQLLGGINQMVATLRHMFAADVYLHAVPMFHLADLGFCIASVMTTCGNAFIDRFDLEQFVATCNRDSVTWTTLVPTMVRSLCLHLEQTGQALPTLRGIMYGAAPMPASVLEMAMRMLPEVEFVQGYGLTEAVIAAMLPAKYHTLDEQGRRLLRSAGRPLHGVLISIQDENDRQLPPETYGEICVRSNSMMKGYWRRPDLTAKAIRNNWYHTGDGGYLDREGFLYIADRVKDMIISGGENVYPAEVENALYTHPAVSEAAVIGIADERWGEAVHAIVRCRSGESVAADALREHVRGQVAGYKVPKSIAFVSEPLPKTPVGKIDKAALRRATSPTPAN
ncbi:MAG: long-chain-fatty-acid--CoA ligase [Steroidobacteraceae bacterium]